MRYKESGVDIDKANEANKLIGKAVSATWGESVLSEVGHFGGLFRMPAGMKEPVLVSSMDGVGTKLMVAHRAGVYDTIGRDLVNHCVNDILVQGARPLFFLDYIAAGKLQPTVVAGIVGGLGAACSKNGCALIGGETAEMPGLYHGEDFDVAGTIVGVVERADIIDGSAIAPGDVIYAFAASGLHTNGYSLARRIVFEGLGLDVDDNVEELSATVGEELLRVHRSYVGAVSSLRERVSVKGLAHITGGGVLENLPRILPDGTGATINKGACPILPVFPFLQKGGDVPEMEMYRVFNMGMGMLAVVSAADAAKLPESLDAEPLYRVGEIVSGSGVELA